ncbi:hypothetical protein MAC_05897 [Metarhizium acridum CQMa 102]|uniref:Uncharacterized protein n=1 Tax=Metarhizium acridum (strain CQMa 102) TaxID=655827 RepID=E9E7P9_METAQ|nr:uncharacterized protein MAC_05897 [Metarhizium acridum CQMa 102]EFY88033.1 hypothetical protein MAC_05897 [Metarhizium acridum CQMa 102]
MPLNQESRERRRRQNRESQQRRSMTALTGTAVRSQADNGITLGQRQKQPSGPSTIDGLLGPVGQKLTVKEATINTPFMSLPPSPPYPEYLHGSQALVSYFVQDPPHWVQHQPKSHGDSQSAWPLMGLDFPVTRNERDEHFREDGHDNVMLQPVADDIISSPHVQYQSPASVSQSTSSMSSHAMLSGQPRRSYSQVQHEQSASDASHRRSDTDAPAACLGANPSTSQAMEKRSPAEKAIKEVQVLYKLGVKVGFLKRDDRVRNYLAAMRRKYHKMPFLRDEDCESSSYTDDSYGGDSE